MDSKQALEALFEFAVAGILVMDKAGLITRINPAAEHMFGYETVALIGKSVETVVPQLIGHTPDARREDFSKTPFSQTPGIGKDLFGKRKNNSEFPVEISLSPFTGKDGQHFVIVYITDITIRRAQEEILRGTLKDLQYFSEELKVSNEELRNFAYVASHDLQEPLRKIQSFGYRLSQLEGEKLSEHGKDYLGRMLHTASRMQVLINDLLGFSRLTAGAKPFVHLDLNKVLQEVLSDLEVSIEEANARIIVGSLPVIDAEPTQMRQLFQNLISNAIKFRRKDELVIHIDSRYNEKEQKVELIVQDNGIGFEEKHAENIFNIFQRLEGKRFEGTGIGLAICRKIAIWHGGTITAKGESGRGATFIVTIPPKHLNTARDIIHSI
jgi:two-component system sensor kinase FixL